MEGQAMWISIQCLVWVQLTEHYSIHAQCFSEPTKDISKAKALKQQQRLPQHKWNDIPPTPSKHGTKAECSICPTKIHTNADTRTAQQERSLSLSLINLSPTPQCCIHVLAYPLNVLHHLSWTNLIKGPPKISWGSLNVHGVSVVPFVSMMYALACLISGAVSSWRYAIWTLAPGYSTKSRILEGLWPKLERSEQREHVHCRLLPVRTFALMLRGSDTPCVAAAFSHKTPN